MYCGGVVRLPGRWPFKETGESVKVLGVHLGKDQGAARNKTWKELVSKINSTRALWKMRGLTLRGGCSQLLFIVHSKMIHILTVYDIPSQIQTNINNSITTFLWGSKRNSIAHKTIISNYRNGGLKLVDITTKKLTLRIKIIKKYLEGSNDYAWKSYFNKSLVSRGDCKQYNLCQTLPRNHYSHLNPFEQEIFEAWSSACSALKLQIKNKAQLMQIPIFHNPDLTYSGRVLSCSSLIAGGINTISGILNEGKISKEKVFNRLKNKGIKIRRKVGETVCGKIENASPFQ